MSTAREAKHCWELVYGNGAEVDTGDCVPHYRSEDEAAKEAGVYTLPSLGVPLPRQLDHPCVEVASCGCCDEQFGEDAVEHFDSQAEADQAVKDAGWVQAEDGALTCNVCLDDCDCQDEAATAETGGA
jgi:hypothetical protein